MSQMTTREPRFLDVGQEQNTNVYSGDGKGGLANEDLKGTSLEAVRVSHAMLEDGGLPKEFRFRVG